VQYSCLFIQDGYIYSMSDENKIIEGAINGDENCCEKILNLYKTRIFSYILRIIKNYDDAEELTFETFIRFFKSIRSFDKTKPLSPFLLSIAHNLVIDFLRKNKIDYEYIDEMHTGSVDFVEKYKKDKRLQALEQALEKLAPIDREIIILFHKEELSYQEIGKILNLPLTTIKTRLHRARNRLKELLKKDFSKNGI